MRRYRGSDKPSGSTLSPPPYSRTNPSSRNQTGKSRLTTGGSSQRQALSGLTTPVSDNELFMMRGLATASAPFLDPRTKKPMIPPAGRSIPKLKMADLTTSLAPLVESHMGNDMSQPKSPLSITDKRIAEALKEVTASKDMLETFDDALMTPDMKSINARVAHLRKGIGPPSHGVAKLSSSRLGNASLSRTSGVGILDSRKLNVVKVSPKNEEQNIRKLMGQLKEKYLDDMESQLGLAIERRPRQYLADDNAQDQSDADTVMGAGIPRPSTDATEITSRIDKVVREWATESQKFSTAMKSPSSSLKQHSSAGGMTKPNNPAKSGPTALIDINGNIIESDKKRNTHSGSDGAAKNKNLTKISTAFRKSLDPISKRDVRELISIPDNSHIEKLEQEHDERRRAHESVFKNTVILSDASSEGKVSGKAKTQTRDKKTAESKKAAESKGGDGESYLVTPMKTKSLVNSEENEAYKIIREHIAYENNSGPPKLTKSAKPGTVVRKGSSTGTMLRADAAGKALLKYSDSHKKLQSVVNSFTDKVEGSLQNRPGPNIKSEESEQSEGNEKSASVKKVPKDALSSVVSKSTLSHRKMNASHASSTLNQSMKTIGRASSVAQRLGTLMSRVALRNEAYDYEQQQQAKQSEQLSRTNSEAPPSQSIKTQSSPSAYRESIRPNPYDIDDDFQRPNVPPGVSKLDSSQFGKYVEEMKKVAEKAAASFERFKVKQVNNQTDLPSCSEGEDEEGSEPEYSYQGGGEAAAVAAAAAEIAHLQQQERNRAAVLRRVAGKAQQGRKKSQKNSSRKPINNMADAGTGTSPRETETTELWSQIHRNGASTNTVSSNNNNTVEQNTEFKFVPDMSYTDQLMLQKLRKLKEKEGWDNSLLSQEIEAESNLIVGDVPNHTEIESMIKRSTNMNLPREAERASMGPVSLNAILRSRLGSNKK